MTPVILIVDDEPGTRETLVDLLEAKGYRAQAVNGGRMALEEIERQSYDLALIDLPLPDLPGLELLKGLKERSPHTEVIVITDYASLESAVRTLESQAIAYLQKPFQMDEVLAVISRALEKHRLQRENERMLCRLQAINAVTETLGQSLDLRQILTQTLDKVLEVLHLEMGSLYLLADDNQTLILQAHRGISSRLAIAIGKMEREKGLAGKAAREGKPLAMDISDYDHPRLKKVIEEEGIRSMVGVPMIFKGKLVGVLDLACREPRSFPEDEVEFLSFIGGQIGMAIENAKGYEEIKRVNLQIITALAAAIEVNDPYTSGHSEGVTNYALAMAKRIGIANNEIETLRVAGLLHDIGKVGIPSAVLNKPAPLTSAEWAMIKAHPDTSARIVEKIEAFKEAIPLIRHHHEWYNGLGYPSGLSGEEIPLGSRILAVADGLEAMTSDRPYRQAMSLEKTLSILKEGAGEQWDPQIVKITQEVVE